MIDNRKIVNNLALSVSHDMDFAILIFVFFTNVCLQTQASTSCLRNCQCKTVQLYKTWNVYDVFCPNSNNNFPDLNLLKSVRKPIQLRVEATYIKNVKKSDFSSNLTILSLRLNAQSYVHLEDDAFINLADTLQYLNLESIKISFKKPLTFLNGLKNLKKLSLGYNYQKTGILIDNIFSNLSLLSLQFIELDNCNLKHINDHAFQNLPSLRILNLKSNSLRKVPTVFADISNLALLNLENNMITNIKEHDFKGLVKLSSLILSGNEHISLEPLCFSELASTLKILIMRNCSMQYDVPRAILRLKKLIKLDLADNELKNFQRNSIRGEICLYQLDLSASTFPLSAGIFLEQKECLKMISLNRRNTATVPTQSLEGLTKLRILHLRENKIKILQEKAFGELSLTMIDLSENPLTEIKVDAFEGLGSLLSIGLENTDLRDIDFILQYENTKFRTVNLTGTPLICSCTVYEILVNLQYGTLEGSCFMNTKELMFTTSVTKSEIRDYYECQSIGLWSTWLRGSSTQCDVSCKQRVTFIRQCKPADSRDTPSVRCKGDNRIRTILQNCTGDRCVTHEGRLSPDRNNSTHLYERITLVAAMKAIGGWTHWIRIDDMSCSVTCGYGMLEIDEIRYCVTNVPGNCIGIAKRHRVWSCTNAVCEDDSGWGEWHEVRVSACSVSCGVGVKIQDNVRPCFKKRVRKCDGSASISHAKVCRTGITCPNEGQLVNGGWTSWYSVLHIQCTATCDSGFEVYFLQRACAKPNAQNGGKPCPGPYTKMTYERCYNLLSCHYISHWTAWKYVSKPPCSVTCGIGLSMAMSVRKCIDADKAPCAGGSIKNDYAPCNIFGCPGDRNFPSTQPAEITRFRTRATTQRPRSHDRVDGGWSTWHNANSTECSNTCGFGHTEDYLYRKCDNPPPQNGGQNCYGPLIKHRVLSCVERECPNDPGWADWNERSASLCSVTCGVGVKTVTLTRDCPYIYNGKCQGPNMKHDIKPCETNVNCPGGYRVVNGVWTAWVNFAEIYCTATCGNGYRIVNRWRVCANPKPFNGGKKCEGLENDVIASVCYSGIPCGGSWQSHSSSGLTGKESDSDPDLTGQYRDTDPALIGNETYIDPDVPADDEDTEKDVPAEDEDTNKYPKAQGARSYYGYGHKYKFGYRDYWNRDEDYISDEWKGGLKDVAAEPEDYYLAVVLTLLFLMMGIFVVFGYKKKLFTLKLRTQDKSKEEKFGMKNPAFDSPDKTTGNKEI